jgi:hypothetical protein
VSKKSVFNTEYAPKRVNMFLPGYSPLSRLKYRLTYVKIRLLLLFQKGA